MAKCCSLRSRYAQSNGSRTQARLSHRHWRQSSGNERRKPRTEVHLSDGELCETKNVNLTREHEIFESGYEFVEALFDWAWYVQYSISILQYSVIFSLCNGLRGYSSVKIKKKSFFCFIFTKFNYLRICV